MSWEELALNPQAINSLFDVPPSLAGARVTGIVFYQDGPRIGLGIEIPDFPSRVPARWRRDAVNAVALQLDLIDILDVKLSGWSVDNVVDVSLERVREHLINLKATGTGCTFEANFRSLFVAKVHGYTDERFGPRD